MANADLLWLLLIVPLGAAVAFWVSRIQKRHPLAAENDGVLISLPAPGGALSLTDQELLVGYGPNPARFPLVGLTATVEDSGTVNRRMTVTRMATLGPLAAAAPKKLDDREVYVSITGPAISIVKAIPLNGFPTAGLRAREFVLALNQRAEQLADH